MADLKNVLLLCYRGLGHYWPLVVRQLALPPEVLGESLPYRSPYVHGSIEELGETPLNQEALICLKIDPQETNDGASIYVPLRTGLIKKVEQAKHSSELVRISYQVRFTPDYRNDKDSLSYSELVRNAVSQVTQKDDVGDKALVITVPLDLAELGDLSTEKESDRWMRLTRVLAHEGPDATGPAWPLLNRLLDKHACRYRGIYRRQLFLRWTGITKGSAQIADATLADSEAWQVEVGEKYEIQVLSSLLSTPGLPEGPFTWLLRGSRRHFDFFDSRVAISPGIAIHRFRFEPKRASNRPLELTLSASREDEGVNNAPHQFDLPLLVRPEYAFGGRAPFVLAVISLALGVLFAAGVVDREWFSSFGISETWSLRIESASKAIGAFLLIVGAAIGTFLQIRRGTE